MTDIPLPEKNIYLFEMIFLTLILFIVGYFGLPIVNESTGGSQMILALSFVLIVINIIKRISERFDDWKRRESNKEYAEYYEFHKLKAELDNVRLDNEIKKEQLRQLKEKSNK